MAGLKNSCNGFAYTIHSEGGRYVLNITDAAAILVRNEATAKFEVDLNLCPPICPILLMLKFMSPSRTLMELNL